MNFNINSKFVSILRPKYMSNRRASATHVSESKHAQRQLYHYICKMAFVSPFKGQIWRHNFDIIPSGTAPTIVKQHREKLLNTKRVWWGHGEGKQREGRGGEDDEGREEGGGEAREVRGSSDLKTKKSGNGSFLMSTWMSPFGHFGPFTSFTAYFRQGPELLLHGIETKENDRK